MNFQKVNVATARIEGLIKPPYYFDEKLYYAWDILFFDSSSLGFYNMPCINVGDTEEEAEKISNQIKQKFKNAGINEGDEVAIIYGNDNQIIAIGCIGKDVWIDPNDNFSKKTFKDLDVIITSLTVY